MAKKKEKERDLLIEKRKKKLDRKIKAIESIDISKEARKLFSIQ